MMLLVGRMVRSLLFVVWCLSNIVVCCVLCLLNILGVRWLMVDRCGRCRVIVFFLFVVVMCVVCRLLFGVV